MVSEYVENGKRENDEENSKRENDEEKRRFCYFIDNHPSEVEEHLKDHKIVDVEFPDDKKYLLLKLEKNGEVKDFKITLNKTKEWLWLFLTEEI